MIYPMHYPKLFEKPVGSPEIGQRTINWRMDRCSLANVLELKSKPQTIECFDVSHVSGTFVVASMVRFVAAGRTVGVIVGLKCVEG